MRRSHVYFCKVLQESPDPEQIVIRVSGCYKAHETMKKSRFTESQIVAILKVTDSGMKVAEVCRKYGISQPNYYNWKSKYGGMSASDLKRVKELEAELSKLKRMHVDMAIQD